MLNAHPTKNVVNTKGNFLEHQFWTGKHFTNFVKWCGITGSILDIR